MKSKMRLFSWVVALSLLVATASQAGEKAPAFHFVVTGGLMGVSDGSRPFFHSPLFRLKSTSKAGDKFVITNAETRAFRFHDTIFLPKSSLDRKVISAAQPTGAKGTVKGFIGAQLFAVGAAKDSQVPKDLVSEDLTRELGAIPLSFKWEIRTYKGIEILALGSMLENAILEWPKAGDDLDEVLLVRGRFGGDSNLEYLFFPRQVASTDRVFGMVDEILKNDANAQYIDLGDTLFGPDVEDIKMAKGLQELMLKRKPAVLGAAWHDFRAFWLDSSLLKDKPYVASLKGKEILPSLRTSVNSRGKSILFASLPSNSLLLDMVLPQGTGIPTLEESIEAIGNASRESPGAFVVGLSQDTQSAAKAVESPVFDAVLSLVSAKGGALPSYDEIDLTQNLREGLKSVAPLVRVSSIDVTEVSGYVDESGTLTKIVIRRHAVVDGGKVAGDAGALLEGYERQTNILSPGLPSRSSVALRGSVYSEDEYNAILGGLLKGVRSDTEIAIIEKHDPVTPIESDVPLRLAESLLNDRGRAVWLTIKGKYLKRIFKAIKENQFGLEVSVIGGTLRGPTINKREISEAETYRLVVSERVFFAIDRFMSRESLFAVRNLPSSTLQAALSEGSKETIKILAERRKGDMRDDPDIGEARANFASSFPIADLIEPFLERGLQSGEVKGLIDNADGQVRRTIILDISDLDLGLKFNSVSPALLAWQKEAETADNPGFPEPRLFDTNYSQKLFYAKAGLKYIGTMVDGELSTNIKFFQPNLEKENPTKADIRTIRPAKDSVKLEGEVRIPFGRLLNEPPTMFGDIAAFSRLTYETQVWPNKWLTNLPRKDWPFRTNDVRLLTGLSNETLRLGALLDYDISRTTHLQSFSYGFEVSAQGKWNIGSITFKLESSLRQLFPIASPENGRVGLVWLVDGKAEVPIYGGFSLSLLANTTLATRMSEPFRAGYGVLFGFALSYSDRLKWFF